MTEKIITPYNSGNKKEEVGQMFDNIAPRYDFLNHFFSLGIDILWRRKAIRLLKREHPAHVLDVATGTGDLALEAIRMKMDVTKITGVDISEGMLEVGRKKIIAKNLQDRIELRYGDSEQLPFENDTFDGAMVAFGVRNFAHLEMGLGEMYRVLKPGALNVILEFSRPSNFPMKQLYWFYFKKIMPFIGRLISKDYRAYSYLPESVEAFPQGQAFIDILQRTGYRETSCIRLSGGIASIYTGKK